MDTLETRRRVLCRPGAGRFQTPDISVGPATDHDRKYTMRVSGREKLRRPSGRCTLHTSRQNRFSMQGNTPIRPSSMQTSPNCARTRLREHWSSSSSRETILLSDWKKIPEHRTGNIGRGIHQPARFLEQERPEHLRRKLFLDQSRKYVELNGVTSDSWWKATRPNSTLTANVPTNGSATTPLTTTESG